MARTVLFDRYRLLEPAGTGGSAEVWRARDLRTGDIVAVKRLHPIIFTEEAGRQRNVAVRGKRVEQRLRALRREDDAQRSIADDESLARLLEPARAYATDGFPASPLLATAVREVADVAGADDYTAHGELREGDVVRRPGVARALAAIAHASGDAAITATGLVMGTLRYVAPEQLRGETETPASDVYGLAAVAYELFAGRPACDALTPVALAAAQEHGPLPIERVPPGVDAAIRRSLAADPAGRAESVATFAASIATAFADEATVAIPAPVGAATP